MLISSHAQSSYFDRSRPNSHHIPHYGPDYDSEVSDPRTSPRTSSMRAAWHGSQPVAHSFMQQHSFCGRNPDPYTSRPDLQVNSPPHPWQSPRPTSAHYVTSQHSFRANAIWHNTPSQVIPPPLPPAVPRELPDVSVNFHFTPRAESTPSRPRLRTGTGDSSTGPLRATESRTTGTQTDPEARRIIDEVLQGQQRYIPCEAGRQTGTTCGAIGLELFRTLLAEAGEGVGETTLLENLISREKLQEVIAVGSRWRHENIEVTEIFDSWNPFNSRMKLQSSSYERPSLEFLHLVLTAQRSLEPSHSAVFITCPPHIITCLRVSLESEREVFIILDPHQNSEHTDATRLVLILNTSIAATANYLNNLLVDLSSLFYPMGRPECRYDIFVGTPRSSGTTDQSQPGARRSTRLSDPSQPPASTSQQPTSSIAAGKQPSRSPPGLVSHPDDDDKCQLCPYTSKDVIVHIPECGHSICARCLLGFLPRNPRAPLVCPVCIEEKVAEPPELGEDLIEDASKIHRIYFTSPRATPNPSLSAAPQPSAARPTTSGNIPRSSGERTTNSHHHSRSDAGPSRHANAIAEAYTNESEDLKPEKSLREAKRSVLPTQQPSDNRNTTIDNAGFGDNSASMPMPSQEHLMTNDDDNSPNRIHERHPGAFNTSFPPIPSAEQPVTNGNASGTRGEQTRAGHSEPAAGQSSRAARVSPRPAAAANGLHKSNSLAGNCHHDAERRKDEREGHASSERCSCRCRCPCPKDAQQAAASGLVIKCGQCSMTFPEEQIVWVAGCSHAFCRQCLARHIQMCVSAIETSLGISIAAAEQTQAGVEAEQEREQQSENDVLANSAEETVWVGAASSEPLETC
ncbi:hypothetical protein R3P38DRAFT_1060179 [Favolaschia claudopus]|uniref:RING-type domain-containing protein n=1 Tax=Favolaschia claudopus TaxID=2862362 RepID=A0AAW0BGZ5_9AGAR